MGVFLRQADGDLVEMEEQPYEAESVLQRLLADYPGLLAGAGERSHRWVLVQRELGVADADGASARWSLDHLFLDAEGVPTLVEVKRSSDTRIRREVVGQMLDYASNAAVHWDLDELSSAFETRCEREARDPDEVLAEELGADDPGEFWEQVKTNLAAGKLRLVFVADEIPSGLRRVIEYLNEQMGATEVLGIEVRQYVESGAGGRETLVSEVIGQTAAARQRKRGDAGPRGRREELREEFWASLLPRAAERTDLHAGVSPRASPSLGASSGHPGIRFSYVVHRDRSGAYLRIERSPAEASRAIFDQLKERRGEIEREFGEELEWSTRSGVKRCTIGKMLSGGYRDEDRERRPQIQNEMIDAMMRLERALRPHLQALSQG
jgi:hypothetical protein